MEAGQYSCVMLNGKSLVKPVMGVYS